MGIGSWATLASIFAVSITVQPASAGVILFTSQSAFDAAVAGDGLTSTSFNFNSTPSANYATASGLTTTDGVNFVGLTGTSASPYYLSLAPAYFCCNDYNNPNVTIQAPAVTSTFYDVTNGVTDITLPNGAVAFSLIAYTVQAGDYTDSGHDTLNLDVDGVIGQTTTSAGSGTGFIGFISTGPVSSVTLTGSTYEDFIDIVGGEVAIGNALAVPEPSSWVLMIAGGLFLGGKLRARR